MAFTKASANFFESESTKKKSITSDTSEVVVVTSMEESLDTLEENKSNFLLEALMTQEETFLLYMLSGFLTIGYHEMCCLHQCETHRVIYEEASPLFRANFLRLQALATLKRLRVIRPADCTQIQA